MFTRTKTINWKEYNQSIELIWIDIIMPLSIIIDLLGYLFQGYFDCSCILLGTSNDHFLFVWPHKQNPFIYGNNYGNYIDFHCWVKASKIFLFPIKFLISLFLPI